MANLFILFYGRFFIVLFGWGFPEVEHVAVLLVGDTKDFHAAAFG